VSPFGHNLEAVILHHPDRSLYHKAVDFYFIKEKTLFAGGKTFGKKEKMPVRAFWDL
jgi:hypothetical protein